MLRISSLTKSQVLDGFFPPVFFADTMIRVTDFFRPLLAGHQSLLAGRSIVNSLTESSHDESRQITISIDSRNFYLLSDTRQSLRF